MMMWLCMIVHTEAEKHKTREFFRFTLTKVRDSICQQSYKYYCYHTSRRINRDGTKSTIIVPRAREIFLSSKSEKKLDASRHNYRERQVTLHWREQKLKRKTALDSINCLETYFCLSYGRINGFTESSFFQGARGSEESTRGKQELKQTIRRPRKGSRRQHPMPSKKRQLLDPNKYPQRPWPLHPQS